ncbi:MAG: HDOD domain-containing protein [Terracidiphilus sp.]|jgi:EAL and modified HD-GYP domain-containing signal transduction protein
MSTHAMAENRTVLELQESGEQVRYVARQPILDVRGQVYGYELLFRSGTESKFRGSGKLATRMMLDNTILFGLEKLTGGLPAFVNCTYESLAGSLVDVLPPGMTVLEILETVEPTAELFQTCRRLKAVGFRLALDDFIWTPDFAPFVELADYIKVDFLQNGLAARRELLRKLGNSRAVLLAEKVETEEVRQQARAEGFKLFQGYYFCRPTLMTTRKVPANRLMQVEILLLLEDETVDLDRLTDLVKQDASLTYRLLRLVNSPMCAVRQEVNSIHSALLAVGEETFRRMATLAITSELNANRPAEILRMSFVRGRFCEHAAKLGGLDEREQYLLGMVSLLLAMLRVPMAELLPALPLRSEIRQALDGFAVEERCLLTWIEQHERAEWAESDRTAEAHGLDGTALLETYAEAVQWAEDALHSTG